MALYSAVLRSKGVASLLTSGGGAGGGAEPLSIITTLRKLCNHPELLRTPSEPGEAGIAVAAASGVAAGVGMAPAADGFQHLYPEDYQPGAALYSGEDAQHLMSGLSQIIMPQRSTDFDVQVPEVAGQLDTGGMKLVPGMLTQHPPSANHRIPLLEMNYLRSN